MKFKNFVIILVLNVSLLFYSCSKGIKEETSKPLYELKNNIIIPKFDAGNAYNQVKAQVKFGPRDPGSKGHQLTLFYIQNELKKYCSDVELQNFSCPGYDNTYLQLTNYYSKVQP